MKRTVFALVIFAVGVMMLLREMGVETFDWFFSVDWRRYIAPVLIILVGCWMLLHRNHHHHFSDECSFDKEDSHEAELNEVMDENANIHANVMWADNHYQLDGERLTGGQINAMMGQARIDVRNAIIRESCTIRITVMMGQVQMFVPQDVQVEVHSNTFMGQVENNTVKCDSDNPKKLRLLISCMMGNVLIKN